MAIVPLDPPMEAFPPAEKSKFHQLTINYSGHLLKPFAAFLTWSTKIYTALKQPRQIRIQPLLNIRYMLQVFSHPHYLKVER